MWVKRHAYAYCPDCKRAFPSAMRVDNWLCPECGNDRLIGVAKSDWVYLTPCGGITFYAVKRGRVTRPEFAPEEAIPAAEWVAERMQGAEWTYARESERLDQEMDWFAQEGCDCESCSEVRARLAAGPGAGGDPTGGG